MNLSESEKQAIEKFKDGFQFKVTEHFAKLIDWNNLKCPIRKQVVPSLLELDQGGVVDPLAEEQHAIFPHLVHRYPNRVLLLSTDVCISNCRYSLLPDTFITMSDYTQKYIKDIKVGDKVLTHSGYNSIVYDVFYKNFKGNIIEFKTNKNKSIKTTFPHPFLAIKRKDILCNRGKNSIHIPNGKCCLKRHPHIKVDWIPKFYNAKNLEVGDFIAVPIPINAINTLDDDFGKLCGLYLSEGSFQRRKGIRSRLRFSFNYNEAETLALECKQLLEKYSKSPVFLNKYKNVSLCQVEVEDKKLCEFMCTNFGEYSDKKQISEYIIKSSLSFKWNLVKYYFLGDGYKCFQKKLCNIKDKLTYFNEKVIYVGTSSFNLAHQIYWILVELGFDPAVYNGFNKFWSQDKLERKCTPFYRVSISNNFNWNLWHNYNIEKRFDKFGKDKTIKTDKYLFYKITEKNILSFNGVVYDLSVSKFESYVANGLVVHNCTRKRRIKGGDIISDAELYEVCKYIKSKRTIKDVIISGGDPFTMPKDRLFKILEELRKIKHLMVIRIGTRAPIYHPLILNLELISELKKFAPLYINIHINHPKEITPETTEVCRLLTEASCVLGSQTVLLKDVNDDVNVMRKLMMTLLQNRIRPYYIYSADHVYGTSHFWVHIKRGIEIYSKLNGYISGLAVPAYVVDLPRECGKVRVAPNYVKSLGKETSILVNYKGEEYKYQ